MTRKNCRNKRKTLRKNKNTLGKNTFGKNKNGGMFPGIRRTAKTIGSLTGSLVKEVSKSKSQDAFKDQVKGWENSRENKENVRNVSVKNIPKMEI